MRMWYTRLRKIAEVCLHSDSHVFGEGHASRLGLELPMPEDCFMMPKTTLIRQ